MNYKKKYEEVIKKAKEYNKRWQCIQATDSELALKELKEIFPELKESEDERIRKYIIWHLKHTRTYLDNSINNHVEEAIAWLEKQGEQNNLLNFNEAEMEKTDFVSGQFIECRKSFNEFKEENSYWLEYIGDDTYIGRSNNVLNKKFHITPRQLFTLFTHEHCPKENNVNEETNTPTNYGKYVDKCLNDAAKHFFSEGEDKYNVADLFYAGVKCGQSLLEKQGEQKPVIYIPKFRVGDKLVSTTNPRLTYEVLEVGLINELGNPEYKVEVFTDGKVKNPSNIYNMEYYKVDEWAKLIEQKSANKVKPKFNVGDWIVQENIGVYKVIEVCESWYEVVDNTDKHYSISFDKEYMCHLWTIQDANDGDILSESKREVILIFRGIGNTRWDDVIDFHCYYDCYLEDFGIQKYLDYWGNAKDNQLKPATKEQRDILFQKMREASYEWDSKKKELKKIEQKSSWSEKIKGLNELETYILSLVPDRSLNAIKIDTKNIRYIINKEQKPAWNEEDEKLYTSALWHIKNSCGNGGKDSGEYEIYNWLKSIKDRFQPQPKQEWSKEDSERLLRIHQFIWANRKGDTDEIYQQEQDADWLMSIIPQPN